MNLDEFLTEATELTKDSQWWLDLIGTVEDAASEAYLKQAKLMRLWVAMYGTEKE